MARHWKCSTVAVVVFSIVYLAVGAIRSAQNPLTVLAHATKIRDDETTFHWKWTFTSGRRWETFHSADGAGEHVTVLEATNGLGVSLERFLIGARRLPPRTLTYEIEARRQEIATAPGLTGYVLNIKMQGHDGGTPASSRSADAQIPDGEWSRRFQAIQTNDARFDLPARVPLAVVGGKTEVVVFP